MADRLYLFGYPKQGRETRLTLAQLETKWTWSALHPEFRRRILAMLDAGIDEGFECGIGEGARSTTAQLTTFLARHVSVNSGGCCSYNGKRYQLKAGNAPAAPPGSSVHEDRLYEGYALAADLRGYENHWFDSHCAKFGLKNFGGPVGPNVNREEWHFQPIEFANARSQIIKQMNSGLKLITWNLPGTSVQPTMPDKIDPVVIPDPVVTPDPIVTPAPVTPPVVTPLIPALEEDPMVVLIISDVRPPHARWKSNGVTKSWIRDGDASAQVSLRLAECENGTKPSPVDGFIHKELRHGSDDVIASYGPIVGPKPDGFDEYGRLL